MRLRNVATSIVFGTTVTLAVTSQADEPMAWNDLDHFVVNCEMKQEQIEFLNSFRTSKGERTWNLLQYKLMPWQAITDPKGYRKNKYQATGRYDWLINQHLHTLATQCY